MATESIKNCGNCGAALTKVDGELKCVYCGSLGNKPIYKEEEPEEEVDLDLEEEELESSSASNIRNFAKDRSGCFVYIGIAVLVFGAGVWFSHMDAGRSSSAVDSITVAERASIDSLAADSLPKIAGKVAPELSPELKVLKKLDIDEAGFKKLFNKARLEKDEFSARSYITDKTSPQYIDVNGLFVYLITEEKEVYLRFKIQYKDDEWLNIKDVIFNTDSENSSYTFKFEKDSGNGKPGNGMMPTLTMNTFCR